MSCKWKSLVNSLKKQEKKECNQAIAEGLKSEKNAQAEKEPKRGGVLPYPQ